MVRESPIFPGEPVTKATNLPTGTAATYDIFAADASYSQVVTAINVNVASSASVTFTLLVHNGTTAFKIGSFTTATAGSYSLLKNSVIGCVNDYNPLLMLDAGWKLQLTTTSVASVNDCYVAGAPFN